MVSKSFTWPAEQTKQALDVGWFSLTNKMSGAELTLKCKLLQVVNRHACVCQLLFECCLCKLKVKFLGTQHQHTVMAR